MSLNIKGIIGRGDMGCMSLPPKNLITKKSNQSLPILSNSARANISKVYLRNTFKDTSKMKNKNRKMSISVSTKLALKHCSQKQKYF